MTGLKESLRRVGTTPILVTAVAEVEAVGVAVGKVNLAAGKTVALLAVAAADGHKEEAAAEDKEATVADRDGATRETMKWEAGSKAVVLAEEEKDGTKEASITVVAGSRKEEVAIQAEAVVGVPTTPEVTAVAAEATKARQAGVRTIRLVDWDREFPKVDTAAAAALGRVGDKKTPATVDGNKKAVVAIPVREDTEEVAAADGTRAALPAAAVADTVAVVVRALAGGSSKEREVEEAQAGVKKVPEATVVAEVDPAGVKKVPEDTVAEVLEATVVAEVDPAGVKNSLVDGSSRAKAVLVLEGIPADQAAPVAGRHPRKLVQEAGKQANQEAVADIHQEVGVEATTAKVQVQVDRHLHGSRSPADPATARLKVGAPSSNPSQAMGPRRQLRAQAAMHSTAEDLRIPDQIRRNC